ncbi:MAG: alpha-ribazole kinase [Bacillota bacterium]
MAELTRIPSLRDALILCGNGEALVSAADSCGGAGNLPCDALFAEPETVGAFAARTALLEVLCTGARPVFGSICISNDPLLAQRLLEGVRSVLKGSLPLIVSTEKNLKTGMTAIGVALTGRCASSSLRIGGARRGDFVYCAGLPLVGEEVLKRSQCIPSPEWVEQTLARGGVRAALPVGSRGVAAEAEVLARESGLTANFVQTRIDLTRSAGPSTCVLFAAEPGALESGKGVPVERIARLD